MRNFEVDLSMMISRPSNANLRGRMPKYYRGIFSGRIFFLTGSRPDSRASRELNRRPGGPGEGQGGPNKGHLDPNIGQKIPKKLVSSWSASPPCKITQCLDRTIDANNYCLCKTRAFSIRGFFAGVGGLSDELAAAMLQILQRSRANILIK